MSGKQRTRQHILANLSVNHVERFAFLCGHSVERFFSDYGLDLIVLTYDRDGNAEQNHFYIQVKATEEIRPLSSTGEIPLRVKKTDLVRWLREAMPVFIILYEAKTERAYWSYVQAYFQRIQKFDLSQIGTTYTMHLKKTDIVDIETMKLFAEYKARITQQIEEVPIHHEI
jgi:hypothetical protein